MHITLIYKTLEMMPTEQKWDCQTAYESVVGVRNSLFTFVGSHNFQSLLLVPADSELAPYCVS